MSEANNHATSFNFQSNFESVDQSQNEQQQKVTKTVSQSPPENSYLPLNTATNLQESQLKDAEKIESEASLCQKMDWQKVAHKLREYNRKLLKKVFRLEQELAEIDNKYNKYVEKSRTSDVLVAQQAEEIETYQEQIATFNQQLADSQEQCQQQIDSRETRISNLAHQYELNQKQTAQLERECALLQENYNQQACELAAKVKEIKELQTKLNLQQRYALQYKTELKRHLEQPSVIVSTSIPEPVASHSKTYVDNRSIKPWSTPRIPEPKIALPQTAKLEREPLQPSLKISQKTGEIATWSASIAHQQVNQPAVKSTTKQKPQSLAAVDLPTFPRS